MDVQPNSLELLASAAAAAAAKQREAAAKQRKAAAEALACKAAAAERKESEEREEREATESTIHEAFAPCAAQYTVAALVYHVPANTNSLLNRIFALGPGQAVSDWTAYILYAFLLTFWRRREKQVSFAALLARAFPEAKFTAAAGAATAGAE